MRIYPMISTALVSFSLLSMSQASYATWCRCCCVDADVMEIYEDTSFTDLGEMKFEFIKVSGLFEALKPAMNEDFAKDIETGLQSVSEQWKLTLEKRKLFDLSNKPAGPAVALEDINPQLVDELESILNQNAHIPDNKSSKEFFEEARDKLSKDVSTLFVRVCNLCNHNQKLSKAKRIPAKDLEVFKNAIINMARKGHIIVNPDL